MGENWIVGNEHCSEALVADYQKFGSWLLVGEDGLGKATLLLRFASWLLPSPSGDLCVLGRNGSIGVDDIRRVADFVAYPPSSGQWKIVIIDGADKMTYNAANALLKLLEERGSYALCFLTSKSQAGVLGTIQSRCRKLFFGRLSSEQMRDLPFLRGDKAAVGQAEIALSGGSPGRLRQIIDNDGLLIYQAIVEAFCGRGLLEVPSVDNDFIAYLLQVFLLRAVKSGLGLIKQEIFSGELDGVILGLKHQASSIYQRYQDFINCYSAGVFGAEWANCLMK